jgi:UDP-N-acetylglucosamine--N-acetylmuramyl-(pentapeptide) pyrophosphoryl-undecaprenol N-acetylglucosamine transferase
VHVTVRKLEALTLQRYRHFLPPKDQERVIVKGFLTNLYQFSGAADVILTRAGGTSMAEFAAQAKACVVVPNPQLTRGHQHKNAQVLADRKAEKLVDEAHLFEDHHALMPPLTELFDQPERAKTLGLRLADLAQPNAAHLLAVVVLEVAERKPPGALST